MNLKKTFTLIELIIVVSILAILSVAVILTLTKWIAWSRNTTRINDLNTISKALISEYSSSIWNYPDPWKAINIYDLSGNLIAKEWLFDESVWLKVWQVLPKLPKDPSLTPNDGYYGYTTIYKKKWFELITYLEDVKLFGGLNEARAELLWRIVYVLTNHDLIQQEYKKIDVFSYIHRDLGTLNTAILSTWGYIKIDVNNLTWETIDNINILWADIWWWTYEVAPIVEVSGGTVNINDLLVAIPADTVPTTTNTNTVNSDDIWNWTDDQLKNIFSSTSPFTQNWEVNNCDPDNITIDRTNFSGWNIWSYVLSPNTIYMVPDGIYNLEQNITFWWDCIAIIWQSKEGVIFSGGTKYISISIYKNIILDNFSIKWYSTYGVYIYRSSSDTLKNLIIESNWYHSIYSYNANNINFYNIDVWNNRYYGAYIYGWNNIIVDTLVSSGNDSYWLYLKSTIWTFSNIKLINNGSYSMYLYFISSWYFKNIEITSNSQGIYTYGVSNISLLDVIFSGNYYNGIISISSGWVIDNVKIFNSSSSISFYVNNTKLENIFFDNSRGIIIAWYNNKVRNIKWYNHTDSVYMRLSNSKVSDINVDWNNVGYYWVRLSYSNNNDISNIVTYNTRYYGLYIYSSNWNIIKNIETYNNGYHGVYASRISWNKFLNMAVYNNKRRGIYIYSWDNNFFNNVVIYNNAYDGIYIYSLSTLKTSNILSNILLFNNYTNTYFSYSSGVFSNFVTFNAHNWLTISSSVNSIFNKGLVYNNTYGIKLFNNSTWNIYYWLLNLFNNDNDFSIDASSSLIAATSVHPDTWWSTGTLVQGQDTMSCDWAINVKNEYWQWLLDENNNCANRGYNPSFTWKIVEYKYGVNVPKQVQPYIRSWDKLVPWGQEWVDWDPNKYIGQW